MVALGLAAALAYVYGQVRRFLPGRPVLQGALWGTLLWALAGPFLVVQTLPWLSTGTGTDGAARAGEAVLVVAELALGFLLYGAVLGLLTPRRR
jgi:hypothetical protein